MLRHIAIYFVTLLLILAAGTPSASATEWDGRTVLLLFTGPNVEDPGGEQLEAELSRLRESLRPQVGDVPLVIMRLGEQGSDPSFMPRLGFRAEDLPVLCVVEWGNPARFGPKRVLNNAIVRKAQSGHAARVLNAFLAASQLEARVPEPPAPKPAKDTRPGKLELEAVRFEVGGTVLNVAARVRNTDTRRLEEITVRFYVRLPEATEWTLLAEQTIAAIPAGQVATRDHLTDTVQLGMVSTAQKPAHCFYKVEVEHYGSTATREGEYRSPGLETPFNAE